MAETATKTTNPRSRARTTTAKPKATTATTAAAKSAPVEEEATDTQRLTFTLAPLGDTKNYSTFDISKDVEGNATGCVGKFYAPLGTETVKVLVAGPIMGEAE